MIRAPDGQKSGIRPRLDADAKRRAGADMKHQWQPARAGHGFISIWGHVAGRLAFILLSACLMLLGGSPRPAAAMPEHDATMVVGVRAHLGVHDAIRRWQPTIDYLNEKIAGARFILKTYPTPESVIDGAAMGEFDFVITDPGSFVTMEVEHGVKSLLSLVVSWQGRPVRQFGSVIFTRRSDSHIVSLGDLRGRTLMAVAPDAFGGWLVAKEEFHKKGYTPEKHLKSILFAGGNQRNVVRAVQEGWVDAGVVRTGTLEQMAAEGRIDLSAFHVVAPRRVPGFPFLLSTDLYPEWVLAASPAAPEAYRAAVIDALRALPPDSRAAREGGYVGWTLPLDHWPVHVLFQKLKAGPYTDYGEATLADALWKNRYWLVGIAASVIGLIFALVMLARHERRLARANAELAGLRGTEIEFYRHVLQSHAIVTITDADDCIVYASDRFLEISGYSREEVIGRRHDFLRSGLHPPEFYEEIRRTVRRGETWTGEICNRRKDGSLWWVQTSIIPKMDATGRIIGYASIRTDVTALKAAQREMNLREFLDCVPGESYKFWAEDHRIFFANSLALKATGLSEGEIKGHTLYEFLSPCDARRLRQLLEDMPLERGHTVEFECERRMPDGRRVPTRFHIHLLMPEWGAPRFLATLHDISGLSHARDQVEQLSATLDEFQEQIYMFWPENRRFFYVNRAAREWVGLPEEEIFRLTPADLEGGLTNEELDTLLRPMIEGRRQQIAFQRELRMKEGRLRTIEYDVKYVRPEGRRPRFVAVLRDVTARARAEREVRQLKSTLDLIDTEIYMFWPDSYEFTYLNKKALRRVGWNDNEWHGKHTYDNITENQQALLEERCRKLIEGPERSMVFEYRDRHGTPLEIYLHLIEPEGEPPRFISVYRDISERKQAEEAKSQFLSTVSHELRTPLTSIKGSLGLLKAGLGSADPARVASMIDIAYANADRLHRLVDDILDWEKIEAGKMTYHMEECDLVEVLRDAVTHNEAYGRQHGVRFRLDAPRHPVMCRLDRDRIAQVLANLLSNAAKFSGDSDEVEVILEMAPSGTEAVVRVRDHGIGIPEAAKATIFDRFTQADSSDVRKAGGTGLGLSISRAIVEAHGGSMDFESTEGVGTVFYFDLPLSIPAEAGDSPEKDAGKLTAEEEGPRVLVIESGTEMAMDLWLRLEQAGCRARVVTSAPAALEAMAADTFEAVVINAALAGGRSAALLRRVRRDSATKGCDVILYTPADGGADRDERLDTIVATTVARLQHGGAGNVAAQAAAAGATPGGKRRRALAIGDRHADPELVNSLARSGAEVIRVGALSQAGRRLEGALYDVVALDPSEAVFEWEKALEAFIGGAWPRVSVMVFAGRRSGGNQGPGGNSAGHAFSASARPEGKRKRSAGRDGPDTAKAAPAARNGAEAIKG
jgi:PAS domain S-box-containing protein